MLSLGLGALSMTTRVGLLVALVVVLAMILSFTARQRRGALGGKLSPPKAAWLFWALTVWFLVCPVLAFEPALPKPVGLVLGVFSLNMWIRGLIELYMLYGPKNWRPPYGISHDLFSLLLILGMWFGLEADPALWSTSWGRVGAGSVGVIAGSMILETAYAYVFFKLVEGKTTGEEGVWFADATDPRWRRINLVTTLFNVPLYLWLFALIVASWGVFA